jgi:hypothetical protein
MAQATLAAQTITARFEDEFPNSRTLFEQAKSLFPNGVTHDFATSNRFRFMSSGPRVPTNGTWTASID